MSEPENSPQNELKETLRRLDQIRPEQISIETMREMQQTLRTQFDDLSRQATTLMESATAAVDQADPSILNTVKSRTARLRNQVESLEDQDRKLENAIQQRIMRDGMAAALGSESRLKVFERVVLVLILLVLGLLVYDNVAPKNGRPLLLTKDSIFLIDTVCCAIFMTEFVMRLKCGDSKRFVWRHHWIDFVTSIPIPGEAQLARFGRVARLARFGRIFRVLRFLRFLRLFFLLWRGMDKLQDVIDVKLMKRTLRWAIVVMLMGGFLVYQIEGVPPAEGPDGGTISEGNSVSSFPLALWWSFTTVVTGGFGDIHNPESTSGMVLTAILIVTGMVLVGVFTATLTSLFIGEQAEEIEKLQEELGERIDQLAERIDSRGDS